PLSLSRTFTASSLTAMCSSAGPASLTCPGGSNANDSITGGSFSSAAVVVDVEVDVEVPSGSEVTPRPVTVWMPPLVVGGASGHPVVVDSPPVDGPADGPSDCQSFQASWMHPVTISGSNTLVIV